jgi:hypothetical protein
MPRSQSAISYVTLFVLSLSLRPALADDASDRKDLIEDIDDALEDAADELDELARESSASPVNDSLRYIDAVRDLVVKLGGVKGDDTRAQFIVEKYPSYMNLFRESAGHLTRLKENQGGLKDILPLCESLDKELGVRIAVYVDKKEPLGVEELPKLVESLRRRVDDRWRDADRSREDMQRWQYNAKRFSESDGKWSDVKSELHTSTDEVHREWEADWKAAELSCSNLRRGIAHPKVDEALKQLSAFSKGREEIIRDTESHLDAAAQLLSGSESDGDERDVVAALQKATDVETSLARLRYAAGADPKSNEILEKWPRYVEAYKFGVGQLIELKRWQFTTDTGVSKCQSQDDGLVAFISQFKTPAEIPQIEAKAIELQKGIEASLTTAREQHRKMETWNGNAQKLSISDGKWTYVTGYVRSAAQGSFDHWKRSLDGAERACGDLAKGVTHPKVDQVIKMLRGRTPPTARHIEKHDSTCQGVPAGGFCMQGDQCLDGECVGNKCTECPSSADGRCHPPGTCGWSTFNERENYKDDMCSKPFSSRPFNIDKPVDCEALAQLCTAGNTCLLARTEVMRCFRGGDSRHYGEYNTTKLVVETCDALLKEKRQKNQCK